VKFDAFGVQIQMGAAQDGLFVRDMMQASDLLDGFISLGKPVHVTACQVPSDTGPDAWDAWRGQARTDQAGSWRRPWDPTIQADWLEIFYHLALSRPFVETICWRDLADYEGHYLPHGGLCRNDLTVKPAYERLQRLRTLLKGAPRAKAPSTTPPANKATQ
jgi:hypothetical protein